jgi:hypothetical protein
MVSVPVSILLLVVDLKYLLVSIFPSMNMGARWPRLNHMVGAGMSTTSKI